MVDDKPGDSALSASKSALSVLFSVVFLDNLGYAIVVPYLYFYVQALGGDTFLYGILLGAYSLMSFIFTPLVARLSDRYGRRKILLAALAVACFSYFIFGVASSIWVLFLGRMLSGTTAATVPVAQAYVADVTSKTARLRYLGLLGAAAGIAFVFGPAIGGTLSALYGYGVPSFLASGLALGNLVSAYFLLPEPTSFSIKRTVVTSKALLDALKQRRIVLLLSVYFLFFVAFVFMQSTLSPWLQLVFGFGAFQTGLVFFFFGGISVLTQGVLLPVFNRKLGQLALTLLGVAIFVGGMLVLSATSDLAVLLALAAVLSVGFGIQFASINTLISVNTPEDAQGGALGVAWAIAGAAQTVAPVLAASAFTFGASVGFAGLAFLVSGLVSAVTLPLLWAFKKSA
ncbi:MAG: MFS transporter [Candidatus Bathyarchaeota archaeon]|nr:MFS transporter [Candidatus Bathyarchaeota archaeon]